MNVSVMGKRHVREASLQQLASYLAATGWESRPEEIIPHEPGPHFYRRGDASLYFADGHEGHAFARTVTALALAEGRHPADVLDAIAAQEIGGDR